MNSNEKQCMQFHSLKDVLTSNDPITIVVGNKAEQLGKQRKMLSELGHYLHDDMEVPFGQIVVLITGEEKKHSKDEQKLITGDYLADSCNIKEHNVHAPKFTVGKSKSGMEVGVDPLIVGRKVIDIDGAIDCVVSGNTKEEKQEAERYISKVCSFPL